MKRKKTDAERAEEYRRILGGTQAALNRSKQRTRDLEGCIRELVLAAYGSEMADDEYEELCEIAARSGVKMEVANG